jgi:glycosyltransferase involved in cell wall biosynthesis
VNAAPAPLRLAYLLSQYPAVNHVFMLREVRLLRHQGLEIHVASLRPPDRPLSDMTGLEREEAKSAYYVLRAGFLRLVAAHLRTFFTRPAAYFRGLWCGLRARPLYGIFYFAEAVLVGEWMRRHRLSHLHSHFSSTVAMIVARTFPVTMSAAFHGPAEFEDPAGFQIAEKVRASLFSCAISRFGRAQLMHASPYAEWPKLELTPLGIDPAEFPPRSFRRDPAPFEIVCVGRLAPVKGQHVLLDAVEQLVRQGCDLRLHLAGDGPDRPALERHAAARGLSSRIVFTGNLNQDELRRLYAGSDLMVLSSFGEGLPVVLMEAMAMEIPCVAPWIAGIPELVRDGASGLLVPPGDPDALAGAILAMIRDPELRLRLAREGRRQVLEGFDLGPNGERLAALFLRRLGPASASASKARP